MDQGSDGDVVVLRGGAQATFKVVRKDPNACKAAGVKSKHASPPLCYWSSTTSNGLITGDSGSPFVQGDLVVGLLSEVTSTPTGSWVIIQPIDEPALSAALVDCSTKPLDDCKAGGRGVLKK